MCVPGCQEAVRSALSRRGMLKGAGALAACLSTNSDARTQASARRFTNAVDLTHTLSADFPTFFGVPGIEMQKQCLESGADGFLSKPLDVEQLLSAVRCAGIEQHLAAV